MTALNFITDIIAPPVLGGIIGYSTNWLAIKMLFKPYKEVRIAGIKVPFTPGVIPKERGRIAEKIGEAVGRHLLTSDVLTRELKSKAVKEKLEQAMVNGVDSLEEEASIEALLFKYLGEDTPKYLEDIRSFLQDKMKSLLVSQSFGIEVKKAINTTLKEKLSGDQTLKELVGEDGRQQLAALLNQHSDTLIEGVKTTLRKEAVSEKIKIAIMDLISSKFGALGAMFLDGDSLYGFILEKADAFLDNEINRVEIEASLLKLLDNLLSRELGQVMEEEQQAIMLDLITDKISEGILSDQAFQHMMKAMNNSITELLHRPLKLSYEMKSFIVKKGLESYDTIVIKHAEAMTETMDFQQMITKQINEFDIKELEGIILSIAKKELSAITWFGALLGFVMGIALILF